MALYCILYSAASCVLQVAGMLVLNAHNVADTSGEGFAVRLFRKGNQRGFIRALSDQPAFFAAGFNKVRQCTNTPNNFHLCAAVLIVLRAEVPPGCRLCTATEPYVAMVLAMLAD